MKILIIKRDKIGDLLLTTPMLRHLRASLPGAEIHLLANDYNAWVVADHPDIDRRWIYRRARTGRTLHPGAVLQQLWLNLRLRAERFDVAIVAGGDASARALRRARWIGARRTIAYGHADDGSSPSDRVPLPHSGHESERMLALLAPLGIAPPEHPPLPEFRLPAAWGAEARQWLATRGLQPGGYVVIGLGARRAKKQPTAAQILRWSEAFAAQQGLQTVFMWTPGRSDNPLYPGDDDTAQPVLDAGAPQIHPFRGPLPPAIALIWLARCSIFPDSGLMHFAAASPGGVLGLFAETDVSPAPAQWGPKGARATFLEARQSVAELADAQVLDLLAPWLAAPAAGCNHSGSAVE